MGENCVTISSMRSHSSKEEEQPRRIGRFGHCVDPLVRTI